MTTFGTCLVECIKVSTVTRRVKGPSAKKPVPCPEIIKDYNSGMGRVDLHNRKTAAYKLKGKSWRSLLPWLFFDLTNIFVVNSHAIHKVVYPKGIELLDFKIVLLNRLFVRSRYTPVSHVSRWEVLPASVPL